ncbi:superoxide dismutase [Aquiluna sp.]|nr:superoxide dismutase [Aquiluna sp.]MDA8992794.1 superoxide dismutase [Aquiluna sp.]
MTYTLPDLNYDYSALEPHISARIMELHHSKHHQAYVTGANAALTAMEEARATDNFGNLPKLQKDLAFNLGGHVNHSIFWKNLSAEGGEASGELLAAIAEYFGSYAAFTKHFTAAAMGIQGSGWAYLAWDSLGNRLVIGQLYDQQGNLAMGNIPLLMLDMWEHAFYLDYQNVKADYVKAFWNIINWDDVAKRFESVKANSRSLLLG